MALYYDEILAGNCFGQINVMPSAPKSHNTNLIETKSSPSGLSTQFGIATEDLFHLGRKFLNGMFYKINIDLLSCDYS